MNAQIIIQILSILQGFLNLKNSEASEQRVQKRLNRIVKKRAKLFRFLWKQKEKEHISEDEYQQLKEMLRTPKELKSTSMKYDVQIPRTQADFRLSSNNYFEDWSHEFMEIEEMHKISKGENAVIFIADTGYPDHENITNVRNDLGTNTTTDQITTDQEGHQTHVTGIAVGNIVKGERLGIAPEAVCIPIKCLNHSGSGFYSWIIEAIRYSADVVLPDELKDRVRILNMSLSGSEYNEEMNAACEYATSKGVIIVSAAGNTGTIGYPANLDSPIAVGGINDKGEPTYFTGKGEKVDLALPATAINSTYLGNSFAVFNGTSQGSPKAAGFIACLVSALPELRGTEAVRTYLKEHLTDIHTEGKDDATGYGTIKASKFAADILRRRAEKEVEELPEEKETELALIEAIRYLYPIDEIKKIPEYRIVRIAELLSIAGIEKKLSKSKNAKLLTEKLYPNK